MSERSSRAVLASALALLLAVPAGGHAQATDSARAEGPRVLHYEGVPYLTGGVTLDEREALQEIAAREGFNLKVVVATADGSYLSDVEVRVMDSEDTLRLEATTDGPWLYARLPEGEYRIEGVRADTSRAASVSLSGETLREVVLRIP